MNCQEFERTIIDLGCDHLMEASTAARALAHAEACVQCAARLNREQRMTAGLRAFAVQEATINAPERVRSALRAAFDERQTAAASPPISFRSASNSSASNKLLWGLTAAAMLLLFAITTVMWLREKTKVDITPPVSTGPSTLPKPPGKPPEELVVVPPAGEIHPPPSPVARPPVRRGRRRTPPVKGRADDVAEFFPLTFVAKSGPEEFLQTVRVEISRSTLLLMGLPINIERGEGLIKADIIIGEDGVARAVRILN